ncbi:MAG: hypothetical protein IT381_21905 [Deltaproteobacteria bacterium]|nr:hypothetical protein [Deltaproteobacteria bacterium]
MDAEIRTLLSALVEGQLKLAEAQAETGKTMAELRREMHRGFAKIDYMSNRLDWFGNQVVRGFTRGASRDFNLERRVTKLERQIAALKKKAKKPPKKH